MTTELLKTFVALILGILLCFVICLNISKPEAIILNEARESFVKIIVENEVITSNCSETELLENKCDSTSISSEDYKIFGSGVIIDINGKNYILTANHICNQMIDGPVFSLDGRTGIMTSSPFVMTLEGMLHKVDIKKTDEKNDLCLLDFENNEKYIGMNIYTNNLIPGERVYNLAAPKGVFEPGNVLIFEGFYTGYAKDRNNSMMFSIYAEQGSSGSAIINDKGEIVSIVHSVLTAVDNATLGSDLNEIREFLKDE